MGIITDKIEKIIKDKNLTFYELGKQIDFSDGALHSMIKGKSPFSEKAVNKLLPILEVTKKEFESWIVADKYNKDIIKQAIEERKVFTYKRKSILTAKIDKMLEEKNISRTALAKQIIYSQSALNAVIIGQKPMSNALLSKLAVFFDISENQIISWIVADKYDLIILEMALEQL